MKYSSRTRDTTGRGSEIISPVVHTLPPLLSGSRRLYRYRDVTLTAEYERSKRTCRELIPSRAPKANCLSPVFPFLPFPHPYLVRVGSDSTRCRGMFRALSEGSCYTMLLARELTGKISRRTLTEVRRENCKEAT